MSYNGSVPYEQRVDTVIEWLTKPEDGIIPSLVTLYFESPDHEGHVFGPDSEEVNSAVEECDKLVGRYDVLSTQSSQSCILEETYMNSQESHCCRLKFIAFEMHYICFFAHIAISYPTD